MAASVAVAIALIALVGGAAAGGYFIKAYMDKPFNVSWAYRFSLNGEVLNDYDHPIHVAGDSVTLSLVNITNTDTLTIDHIDIGMEAWASSFPTISGSQVQVDSGGVHYVNVVAGQPINAEITITYPSGGTNQWINSLYAIDTQTSLLGYTTDPETNQTYGSYAYGCRVMLYNP
jgi:hypothetical protein